jgi:hypothetical protein
MFGGVCQVYITIKAVLENKPQMYIIKIKINKPSCLDSSGKELLSRTYPMNTGFDTHKTN